MDDVFVFESKSDVVFEDKPKVDKKAKNSIATSGRKMLADISNKPRRIPSILTQDNKSWPNSSNVEEYIVQLQKENAALMKLIADKNRIIDISGAELHKLRITLQMMRQQNLHLAQSNTQMLSELNSGKDRLKDLQHELGCKNGLLIAKTLELEGKRKTKTSETNENKKPKVSEQEEIGVHTVAERDKDQHHNTIGRQKSKSLGPCVKKVQEKGACDNGRPQARRQSARFKHDEPKPAGVFSCTDEMNEKMQEDVVFSLPNKACEESRRSSISRPSRDAAKKVQSYKEISLNVKMRRPERLGDMGLYKVGIWHRLLNKRLGGQTGVYGLI
ncbi:hypothetical protein E3N88_07141 [Mikania micrantha]|uniref:Shugoshin C-terminal domain-containing protein n=1 Tax=Mikania micrantha TaxID=192012 RepID=A0A5N6PST3_9ASTR|nr:hypothetical protein E3N88_07141 [Mikania micrantha]